MSEQTLWTRKVTPFNFSMTGFTQRNQIMKLISRFPVVFKFSIWLDMVNTQNPPFSLALLASTNGTFMSIARFCCSALLSPIRTAKDLPAAIVLVARAALHKTYCFIATFFRTVPAASISSILRLMNVINCAANFTRFIYAFSRNLSVFGLSCSKYRATLSGTKAPRMVWATLKRYVAPFTYTSLGNFHSILANAISHGVCDQSSTSAAFSRSYSLGHIGIIPRRAS